ncbi:MAG: CorA family divalent cation transporter [Candidatus Pacebacteria bacterium]|nr:CorA family divalent cation transporter [Candidatus Paceibacterota bacterium]
MVKYQKLQRMIETHIQGKTTWVDVKSPTNEEVRELIDTYNLPPTLANDFVTPVPRSTASEVDGFIKMTMDFPIVRRTDMRHPHEIKFVISQHTLITIRYEDMEAIDKFRSAFEIESALKKNKKRLNGADLFFSLIGALYASTAAKLDYIQTRLTDIETEIFDGNEREMVFHISEMNRKLINFKQTLKAHDDVFRDAKPLFEHVFKKSYGAQIQDVHMHYYHLIRRTMALFETLHNFKETNSALLTTKQNEIMKIFTILAFVTFPLTLFSSMFGMNTKATPIIGADGDFWIILGAMTVVAFTFFGFFKFKKWL